MKSAKEWAELASCSPPGTILGPMSMGTMRELGGMQTMTPEEAARMQAQQLGIVSGGVFYPKLPGEHCPECKREFINNISCPRCGWRLPR
jgi:hypothetical protein